MSEPTEKEYCISSFCDKADTEMLVWGSNLMLGPDPVLAMQGGHKRDPS